MANSDTSSEKREFRCDHCDGKIMIPWDLPPTTGPCPHCSGVITSPAPEVAAVASRIPPVPPPAVKPPVAIPPPVPAPAAKAAEEPVSQPVQITPTVNPPAEIPHASAPSTGNKRKHIPKSKPEKADKSGLIPVMLVLLLIILGSGAAVIFVSREMGNQIPGPSVAIIGADPAIKEASYIRSGWRKEASQVLHDYIAATSSQGKLPYIFNADSLATRVEDFYGGGEIKDSDTPADAFSVYELSEEDRKRGLFMMVFDQPPQFEMKEFFRPLASLEVQYGIDEADLLLSTLARVGNFAMEPMRVHAFFKRTPAGLKLDWEIFVQTKYRTFQNFVELPEIGHTGVFRVFIMEDVPDKNRLEAGTRTYRLADPANTTDTARINVKVDSETGRTLSIINWRGTKESRTITRTATVELAWTGEPTAPELEISRFICWEFLGLGGKETPSTASTK